MLQYLHPSLFIHEANCEFLVKVLRYVAMAKAIPILNSSGNKRWTSKLTSCYPTICTSLLLSSSIKNSYLKKVYFSLIQNSFISQVNLSSSNNSKFEISSVFFNIMLFIGNSLTFLSKDRHVWWMSF